MADAPGLPERTPPSRDGPCEFGGLGQRSRGSFRPNRGGPAALETQQPRGTSPALGRLTVLWGGRGPHRSPGGDRLASSPWESHPDRGSHPGKRAAGHLQVGVGSGDGGALSQRGWVWGAGAGRARQASWALGLLPADAQPPSQSALIAQAPLLMLRRIAGSMDRKLSRAEIRSQQRIKVTNEHTLLSLCLGVGGGAPPLPRSLRPCTSPSLCKPPCPGPLCYWPGAGG